MDARLGLVSQSEEPFSRFLTLWQPAVSWRVLWGMWLSNSAGQAVLMHTRILGLSIRAVVEVTKMGHFLGTRGLDLTSSPFGDCCTMTMCNIRLHRGVIILHSWISLLHTFMKSCQTLATHNSFDLKQTSALNSEQLCVGWKQRENNQFCNSNRCFVCWKQCVIYPHTYICIISPTMELMDKLFEQLVNNKKRHHGRFCMIYKVIKTITTLLLTPNDLFFHLVAQHFHMFTYLTLLLTHKPSLPLPDMHKNLLCGTKPHN